MVSVADELLEGVEFARGPHVAEAEGDKGEEEPNERGQQENGGGADGGNNLLRALVPGVPLRTTRGRQTI